MSQTLHGSTGQAAGPTVEMTGDLTRHPHDLDVQLLPECGREWIVCDRRIPSDDARSLLGFIEERHGQFEAMELGDGHGLTCISFASLTGAIEHFARPSADAQERRAGANRVMAREVPSPGGHALVIADWLKDMALSTGTWGALR